MNSSQTVYQNPMADARPDEDMVRAFLTAVTSHGAPFEVRILNTRRGPARLWAKTYSGFFTDVDTAVQWVCRYGGSDAAGIYVTLNPLADYVLNWNQDRIDVSVTSTSDEDVTGLRWLFLDIDPVRPRYTCATPAEQEAAKARGNELSHFLMSDIDFPMPAWAGSSGSGVTALWRIDLEPEEAPLIEKALAALDAMFTDSSVKVDAGVGNPARIARIAGTINAKSTTPQPDRPWRMATGKAFDTSVVTRAQLEELAALAPPEEAAPRRHDGSYDGPAYNLPKLLEDAGIEFTEKRRSYGTAYDLTSCLTSDEHDTGASFFQFDSGAVAYKCLHDSCHGKGWQDVKAHLGIVTAPPMRITTGGKTFTPIKIGANGRVAS